MSIQKPWPPERCLEVSSASIDLGNQPPGEYVFRYLRGAASFSVMTQDWVHIDFSWNCNADLDVRVDLNLQRSKGVIANGYYCYYSCSTGDTSKGFDPKCYEYIIWHGIPNYHDPSYGSQESYSVNVYRAWEEGRWSGSVTLSVYAWWWYRNTVGCPITVTCTWGFQQQKYTFPSAGQGNEDYKVCGESYARYKLGDIVCHEGGYFTFSR